MNTNLYKLHKKQLSKDLYFGNATADSEYDFQVTQNMDVLVTMLQNSLYYIHIIYSESPLVLHVIVNADQEVSLRFRARGLRARSARVPSGLNHQRHRLVSI